jgi:hypothetical protein
VWVHWNQMKFCKQLRLYCIVKSSGGYSIGLYDTDYDIQILLTRVQQRICPC